METPLDGDPPNPTTPVMDDTSAPEAPGDAPSGSSTRHSINVALTGVLVAVIAAYGWTSFNEPGSGSSERITGAFGLELGTKLDSRGMIEQPPISGFTVHKFHPSGTDRMFDHHFVKTTKDEVIFFIEGVAVYTGGGNNLSRCKDDLETVVEDMKRFGRVRPFGGSLGYRVFSRGRHVKARCNSVGGSSVTLSVIYEDLKIYAANR